MRVLDAGAEPGRRGRDRQDDVAALANEVVELRELNVDVIVGVGDD
jgi:hypothetical protein